MNEARNYKNITVPPYPIHEHIREIIGAFYEDGTAVFPPVARMRSDQPLPDHTGLYALISFRRASELLKNSPSPKLHFYLAGPGLAVVREDNGVFLLLQEHNFFNRSLLQELPIFAGETITYIRFHHSIMECSQL